MRRETPAPWICEQCHRPIDKDIGVILIADRRSIEKPGYDPDAPQQLEALGDHGEILIEETTNLQIQAGIDLLDDPGVEFRVYHKAHAPEDRGEYVITTDRAMRIEQWAAWMTHLGEKTWIKKVDLVAAIRFWCTGRGLRVQDDLT